MSAEVFIPLTKGRVAVIDFADFESVRGFNWHTKMYKGVPYAARTFYDPEIYITHGDNGCRSTVLMHRQIAELMEFPDVDHVNRNTLDNRRINLRPCTRSQNCANQKIRSTNTSGFKGVNLKRRSSGQTKWCARISVNYKRIQLGYFLTAKEAARAYDAAALKHFGEFARLNFPHKKG